MSGEFDKASARNADTAPNLSLPPIYRVVVVDDTVDEARAHAAKLAAEGGEAGLFVWRPAADRIDCAILLRPEDEIRQILPVALIGSLALLEALGAAGPAALAADLVWPATVRINSGHAGGIALDLGPGDPPEWAVVSAVLRKTGEPGVEGGERPDVTCLADEGFAEVADSDIAEAYARHFLVWMDRWEEGGIAPIARRWLHCARWSGAEAVLNMGGELVAGAIRDIDDAGSLVLETKDGRRILPLTPALLAGDPAET
jgi:BirA family biotin operon repressor/biotin-[acetyl-CoA-carboxylase] ligase